MAPAIDNVFDLPTVMVKRDQVRMPKPKPGERTFSKAICQEIADSIKAKGLLHPPIVRDLGDGSSNPYETVCGIHRFGAMFGILKWDEAPCKVITCDDDDARMIKIIENVARNPLTKEQFFTQVSEWKALHEKKHKQTSAATAASAAARTARKAEGTKAKTKASGAAVPDEAAPAEDAATVEPAAQVEAQPPEPKQPTSFADLIAASMGGVSKATAKRTIRIAKALEKIGDDERKIIFPEDKKKHATQGDLEGLASLPEEHRGAAIKLVGSGMDWGKALEETRKKLVKPADPTKPKSVDDLTDAEWVDTQCATVRSRVKKAQPLANDAIFYRKWAKLRKKLQKDVDELLRDAQADNKKIGPFWRYVYNAFRMKHPNDCLACPDCKGTGQKEVPGADGQAKVEHCRPCNGAGYKVQVEPL